MTDPAGQNPDGKDPEARGATAVPVDDNERADRGVGSERAVPDPEPEDGLPVAGARNDSPFAAEDPEQSRPAAVRAEPDPPPPAPEEPQPVPPATEADPPVKRSNRLAATAWVLLAAGLFEVLYIASLFLYILVEGGPTAIQQSAVPLLQSPFAWAPVLVFAVLYELTVLAVNRAGRFVYVVTSLVVGLLVYFFSIALVLLIQQGGIGDPSVLGPVLIAPQFILAGLIAREVMLWTGFAVGARGRRLRLRDHEDRARVDREAAAAE